MDRPGMRYAVIAVVVLVAVIPSSFAIGRTGIGVSRELPFFDEKLERVQELATAFLVANSNGDLKGLPPKYADVLHVKSLEFVAENKPGQQAAIVFDAQFGWAQQKTLEQDLESPIDLFLVTLDRTTGVQNMARLGSVLRGYQGQPAEASVGGRVELPQSMGDCWATLVILERGSPGRESKLLQTSTKHFGVVVTKRR